MCVCLPPECSECSLHSQAANPAGSCPASGQQCQPRALPLPPRPPGRPQHWAVPSGKLSRHRLPSQLPARTGMLPQVHTSMPASSLVLADRCCKGVWGMASPRLPGRSPGCCIVEDSSRLGIHTFCGQQSHFQEFVLRRS